MADPETLAFAVREGPTDNHFFRRGTVAAHLVATSGTAPRLLFAFPAGNSGAGLWFEATREPVAVEVDADLVPVEEEAMRGVCATVRLGAKALELHGAVLGSVRALRAFAHHEEPCVGVVRSFEASVPFTVSRTTLDGRHRVALRIEPLAGATVSMDDAGRVTLAAGSDGTIQVRVTALTDHAPLTPIPADAILLEGASLDPRSRQALAFLTYEEKLLAGSWRFLTYFGRDTLLALRLLLPVLAPRVVEAGLGAVLDRLGPEGDVAHEEAIGDWASVMHEAEGTRPEAPGDPVLDRSMVDDDFMLAPVVAAYLLDGHGRGRAERFLARRTPSGETYEAALAKNLALVLRRAAAFAVKPTAASLVTIAPGRVTGEWRDSHDGLGGGRIPFNVNAALVPAALAAAARLYASGLGGGDASTMARRATTLARAWRMALEPFHVTLDAAEARRRLVAYADAFGVDPAPALASLLGDVSFPAIALDADGAPVPVMHSDDGFVLLFTDPSPAYLEEAAARIVRPFPAGLRTPAGLVVANPAFAPDRALWHRFTPAHYHGTVIWSWQHALLAAGVRRQRARTDLPERTSLALAEADRVLAEAIDASAPWRTSELWSIAAREGRVERVPFGAARAHHDESNAAQLWSTVFLALG